MPLIHMGKLLSFAPNIGVLVHEEALDVSAEELFQAIHTAYSHMNNQYLCDACCGGMGPLAKYRDLQYEDYLRLLDEIKATEAGAMAKKRHTKIRRAEFNSKRSRLVLTMLDAGIPHVCAISGCEVFDHLTVDHIKPLSRGGTDELSNLRFLCRQHNGLKRDLPEP